MKFDIIKSLEGEEIISLKYAGVVGIKNGNVFMNGKIIDKLNNKKASALLDELFENEFGGASIESLI